MNSKIVAALLAAILTLAFLPTSAFAQSGGEISTNGNMEQDLTTQTTNGGPPSNTSSSSATSANEDRLNEQLPTLTKETFDQKAIENNSVLLWLVLIALLSFGFGLLAYSYAKRQEVLANRKKFAQEKKQASTKAGAQTESKKNLQE